MSLDPSLDHLAPVGSTGTESMTDHPKANSLSRWDLEIEIPAGAQRTKVVRRCLGVLSGTLLISSLFAHFLYPGSKSTQILKAFTAVSTAALSSTYVTDIKDHV